jgi:hypothetical protein
LASVEKLRNQVFPVIGAAAHCVIRPVRIVAIKAGRTKLPLIAAAAAGSLNWLAPSRQRTVFVLLQTGDPRSIFVISRLSVAPDDIVLIMAAVQNAT